MMGGGTILTLQPKLLRWPGLFGKAFPSNLPFPVAIAKPFTGQAGSKSPKMPEITGFPLWFIPYLMRDGNGRQIKAFFKTVYCMAHDLQIYL
jgi:hypothetical protein